ncbi:MAG: arylsulfatase [Sphingomonadales bacterium]|nr:arylsulfatase [Sphingomonadales bacterium]
MKLRATLLAATLLAAPAHAQDRTVLPVPTPAFAGTIAPSVLDSRPDAPRPVRAPDGAPNVLLFMSDDVGFAMSSAFGGPVPTPNIERLAAQGQRYNRFHTTGICSPSRAALLTGRNAHNAGVGFLSDIASGFPGYGGRILPETATLAQVLRLNGYSTAMFGKHHNVPPAERGPAGPFDAWPTGLGFDYFYGFPHGDTDQFSPIVYRGTTRVDEDAHGKLLDERLADDLLSWVRNQQASAPDKPFLAYWAPGSTHAPHQAPPEWIARFKGRFDMGWDKLREETFHRQLALGVIPKGTKLTPRPAEIPAWDSLPPAQKAFAARTMEVAAAQLAFQDAQIGRVLDELQRIGAADHTLVAMILGDNGASAEVGPNGSINELRAINGHSTGAEESQAWMQANTDRLGGPMTYESYPAGFALAMNTPLRWTKQFASMLGGIRNGMILSWPGHVAHPGSLCGQFSHLIDIAPTVLDAANLPAPKTVLGAAQKPLDGQTLLPSLAACDAAKPRTQYFEMVGKVGFYHDGWFLSGEDGRTSWQDVPPGGDRPAMQWTLYDLTRDWSQSTDLAAKNPAKLAEMQTLWQQVAVADNVLPLDHRFGGARAGAAATYMDRRRHYDFWGKDVSVPAMGKPLLFARPYTLSADLDLKPGASGVVVATGSRFGGWSLYLDHGRPALTVARSTDPAEVWTTRSDTALPPGAVRLTMRFQPLGFGKGAAITLSSQGHELARLAVPTAIIMPAGGGETTDIGRDLGVPVADYATPQGALEGEVRHVTVDYD